MTPRTLAADVASVRRRDCAMDDDAWIETLLERAAVGALATVADGQPFLNVNLFWFDAERRALYLHTARRGRTRSNVEAGERVCFAVHEMGRLLPAATALEREAQGGAERRRRGVRVSGCVAPR